MQQSKLHHRMIYIVTMVVVIIILGTILIKSKGILKETEKTYTNELDKAKVTILTSGPLTDQSWGSLAYKGKLKIEEQFPVQVTLYSELTSGKLITEKVTEAIQNGSKLIIGQGREFSETFHALSLTYTDIRFVTIHGTAKNMNQAVYTFDQGEIEYFAALSAALVTKTNKVAIIDSADNRKKNPEFETALIYYNPEIEFYFVNVEDRDNGKKAVKMMKELLAEGVDVIYSKGNSYNRDVIDLAKKEGIYVIGYLDNQSYMGKEHVITSVMNDVPQAYVAIMNDYFSEEGIPFGKRVMLNEDDGVYKLAPFGPMLSEENVNYIKSEMKRYKNGELSFQ